MTFRHYPKRNFDYSCPWHNSVSCEVFVFEKLNIEIAMENKCMSMYFKFIQYVDKTTVKEKNSVKVSSRSIMWPQLKKWSAAF